MIDAAVAILGEGGAAALNARAVAERSGAAVGSLYGLFDSLEALRLEANAVTMRRLRNALTAALATDAKGSIEARLLRLADAYLAFAAAHPRAWSALFERRTIEAPPAIDAGLPRGDEIPLVAKALWSSVHGMVYLGETGGLGPVRPEEVPAMVRVLVRSAVRGLSPAQHARGDAGPRDG